MGAKYYYYPTTSNTSAKMTSRTHDGGYDRTTPSRHIDTRPRTPSLTRASTPTSSGPTTPTFRCVSPGDPKTQRRNVAFASPVAEAFRRPLEDELFVMRRFASHIRHCGLCEDAIKIQSSDKRLCERGFAHAKDLGQYFYCSEGKPFSEIDKKMGRDRVQVEIPGEYESVKRLFLALNNGLTLRGRSRPSRPEVLQSSERQSSSRSAQPSRKPEVATTSQHTTRKHDNNLYEVRPSRTESRRQREPVYQKRGDRSYETRTPYDEYYNEPRQTPIITPSRTPATTKTTKYYTSRPKDDTFYDRSRDNRYVESHPQKSKRYSYQEDISARKRPTSTYLMPYLSGIWR